MAIGDVTTTYLGEVSNSGAVGTALTGLNLGHTKISDCSGSVLVIPIGNQVYLYKLLRA